MKGFKKVEFNQNIDYSSKIKEMFAEIGFNDVSVHTSFANGLSHYVSLVADVIDEGRTYASMFVYDNQAFIKVRISDHTSGLESNCKGVCGNTMTFEALKNLLETGAIKANV
jgi:hypothetical protein